MTYIVDKRRPCPSPLSLPQAAQAIKRGLCQGKIAQARYLRQRLSRLSKHSELRLLPPLVRPSRRHVPRQPLDLEVEQACADALPDQAHSARVVVRVEPTPAARNGAGAREL